MTRIGIVLLAAGESRRMGQAKQLLPHQGQTLIGWTLSQLKATGIPDMVAVLGAQQADISPICAAHQIPICSNPNFATGMASSIHAGIQFMLQQQPAPTHLLIALGDQAALTASHYQQLVTAAHQFPEKIIAAHYNEIHGAPMVFPQRFFPALLQLQGDTGARKLIHQFPNLIHPIALPEAAADWDRPEDVF